MNDHRAGNPNRRSFRERFPARNACRGTHGGYFTDSFLLAEVLRPLVTREGASLSDDFYTTLSARDGGLTVLAERAALELNIQPGSIYRRLYEVMNDISDSIKVETAEALVNAAGEIFCNEPLPILPGGGQAAYEMAEAWADEGEDVHELAHRLLRFAIGFQAAEEIVSPENFKARQDRRNASLRRKRARQKVAA